MITVNKMGDSIVGSVNNESFGIPYVATTYDAMLDLQKQAETATTMDEYKAIIDQFPELLKVDYKAVVESKCEHLFLNEAKGTYHLKVGDKASKIPMPQALVDRILDSMDKGLDFEPLIKMWTRWLRNPVLRSKTNKGKEGARFSEKIFNYINSTFTNRDKVEDMMEKEGVSEEVAVERCTTYQVGITVEGLLKTFKVSDEIHTKFELDEDGNRKTVDRKKAETIDPDTGLITYTELNNEDRLFQPAMMGAGGDEFYCGDKLGHFIKVGKSHRLSDWSKVNTDDDRSCVKGLHCGGLDYIRGYQSMGSETHNILVDPMNVGAVPNDDTGAIRVLEYYVLDAFSGVNGSIYHSSSYAEQSDEKWDKDRKEALSNYGELKTEADEEAAELEAL
jgi:hypothetical protein